MSHPDSVDPDRVDPEEWEPRSASSALDAPEGDAAEQSRPVSPDEERPTLRVSFEVNEADAVEQALVVPHDDDYDR